MWTASYSDTFCTGPYSVCVSDTSMCVTNDKESLSSFDEEECEIRTHERLVALPLWEAESLSLLSTENESFGPIGGHPPSFAFVTIHPALATLPLSPAQHTLAFNPLEGKPASPSVPKSY